MRRRYRVALWQCFKISSPWLAAQAYLVYSLPFQAAAFLGVGLSVYYFRGDPVETSVEEALQ